MGNPRVMMFVPMAKAVVPTEKDSKVEDDGRPTRPSRCVKPKEEWVSRRHENVLWKDMKRKASVVRLSLLPMMMDNRVAEERSLGGMCYGLGIPKELCSKSLLWCSLWALTTTPMK